LISPRIDKLLEHVDSDYASVLVAAKLIGETGDVRRFRSADAFAALAGVAPIPASSGQTRHMRLNRGGNRQLNAALHRIAITQVRLHGPGQLYLEKQMAAGHSKTEALRSLRRRLSDEVYRRLLKDHGQSLSDNYRLSD